MTCKDCIHYGVCNEPLNADWCIGRDSVETHCEDFADKSRFVELPFAIGQTVYRIVCDCDNCEYCATEVCYTHNEHPCKLKIKKKKFSLIGYLNGSEYFATKEEAEKALKEREKNETGHAH